MGSPAKAGLSFPMLLASRNWLSPLLGASVAAKEGRGGYTGGRNVWIHCWRGRKIAVLDLRKKLLLPITLLPVLILLALLACASDADTTAPEATAVPQTAAPDTERETIIFSDLNWASALVQNRIAQYIVEKGYGYPTELVFGGTLPLFQGLKRGDTHVTMEIWIPNLQEQWEEAVAAGEVLQAGDTLGSDWQSTFVIPKYLQNEYPELDHVDDLKDPMYRELFADAESRGKARIVICVPGWACELVNEAQIKGYGLEEHLHVIRPGSEEAMFAEIYGAVERGDPWLGYMWGIGDPAVLHDLVRLEEPPYSDECWQKDMACAFENTTFLIGVHPSIPQRAPDIMEFLDGWDFTTGNYADVLNWMHAHENPTYEQAALNWLKENAAVWSAWIPADAVAPVQAALDADEIPEGWPDE